MGGHRWWTRSGTQSVKPPTGAWREKSGKSCTTSLWKQAGPSTFANRAPQGQDLVEGESSKGEGRRVSRSMVASGTAGTVGEAPAESGDASGRGLVLILLLREEAGAERARLLSPPGRSVVSEVTCVSLCLPGRLVVLVVL